MLEYTDLISQLTQVAKQGGKAISAEREIRAVTGSFGGLEKEEELAKSVFAFEWSSRSTQALVGP